MNKIFIRFTIKSDKLNLLEIRNNIRLEENVSVYQKGEIYELKYNVKAQPQKTNRWVYSIESVAKEKLNALLKRMFKDLKPHINDIRSYTKKYYSIIEIIIYEEEQKSIFNTNLSKENLKLLNLINTRLSITFIDF